VIAGAGGVASPDVEADFATFLSVLPALQLGFGPGGGGGGTSPLNMRIKINVPND